jgi:hypothetical protein
VRASDVSSGDRCGAKLRGKQAGKTCANSPNEGGKRCWRHGGNSPQAKAAAARRVAEAEARETMARAVRTLGLPIDIDPGKALLDEIHWTAGHVAWLRGKVQELEDRDLVWGQTQTDQGIGPQGPVDTTTEKAGPNVWYTMYLTEREHLARVCALALKAGIEERKIKLAEDQGLLVADVIRRILGALGLTPEQQQLVPVIVPRELRALAGGA